MEKEIENLIEQLTKVRPEMLNEEALKLFNTIMAVLDERDRLKEENKKKSIEIICYQEELETNYIPKSKIKEKIDEQLKEANDVLENGNYLDNFNGSKNEQKYYYDGYKDATIFISELMEEE